MPMASVSVVTLRSSISVIPSLVPIDKDYIENFCALVGNQNEVRKWACKCAPGSYGLCHCHPVAGVAARPSASPRTRTKVLKWLFHSGLRGQQAFPLLTLEPSVVQDSVEGGGERTPSPMLSMTGLSLKDLEGHIAKTNKHLTDFLNWRLTLQRSQGLCRQAGLLGALLGVLYHSKYFENAADEVLDDLEGKGLWTKEDLGIPVYHMENGTDLPTEGSLTRALCDQIFTLPIHWSKATNFPQTATRAVDFGPGGLSGIGPLTARNLEGRGVCVIVAGGKAKGR
ncbi:hypothetical protein OH77DRAFT_1437439 [Trametes cingulata]|nr:hypothetical protein OH77DRAFT_1437439 [Trametes cingulata]